MTFHPSELKVSKSSKPWTFLTWTGQSTSPISSGGLKAMGKGWELLRASCIPNIECYNVLHTHIMYNVTILYIYISLLLLLLLLFLLLLLLIMFIIITIIIIIIINIIIFIYHTYIIHIRYVYYYYLLMLTYQLHSKPLLFHVIPLFECIL